MDHVRRSGENEKKVFEAVKKLLLLQIITLQQ